VNPEVFTKCVKLIAVQQTKIAEQMTKDSNYLNRTQRDKIVIS
jgi:hypothetical protein